MAKILKKVLSITASAAITASVITVPIAVNAAGATATFADNILTITSDKDYTGASVYVVKYKENNSLESVKLISADLAAGENKINVTADEGDRIMVWDGQTPIVETVTVKAPVVTEAPTTEPEQLNIINTWKFDFGSAEDVAEGFTAVTADVNYTLNTSGDYQYGFIGTNEKDYKLAGGRVDGFDQQEGQVITLSNGGGTGLNDAIGSTGEDAFGNAGDKFYPVRFALNAGDEKYFRVKAYVTTLDPAKDAEASLYTERKHPLYTSKTIKAGETEVTEFTVRTTPIYYEKSDPKGAAADGMVNVCVLGENTALAALEIYEIDTAPVLWVLGDSTVTDGGGSLPFWPLQNYTGVGTGLTKYLPKNIAMVNEGEGGLAANDNNHFNMVKNRIKAGDFMYVEYGHNHKSDGVDGYKSYLDKYYNACKEKGATLILVGPIDRHNDSQYNSAENIWSSTLGGYSAAAKEYVDAKIAGGAADIAFVDLNQPSLDWYTEITKGGTVAGTEYTNNIKLTNYYFMTAKGGGTDGTHPNDAGAENLAYFFFSTADTEAYPALAPLMTRYKAGKAETPNPVAQYVLDAGWASNSTWPQYMPPVVFEYPIVVQRVAANGEGILELTAKVQMGFSNYASGVLEIYNEDSTLAGKYVTVNHIDNTTGNGVNTLQFAPGVTIGENQTYKAYMWSCYLDREELMPEAEGGEQLSAIYEPTDIVAYIVPGDGGEVEDFDYYGKASLTDVTKYVFGGSAGHDLSFGSDSETNYVRIMSDGAKNGTSGQGSFYIMRPLENLDGGTGSTGRYMIDVDLKYVSGGGLNFGFAKSTTPNRSPFVTEGGFTAFSVGGGGNITVPGATDPIGAISATGWTNVKYILDMSAGVATISVAGGTPVEVPVAAYQTFNTPTPDTLRHFIIEGQRVAFDVYASNLTVAKLDPGALPEKTVKVSSADENMGTATVEDDVEYTAAKSTIVTIVATPADGYEFVKWTDKNGNTVGYTESYKIRMYDDYEFIAEFKASEFDPITYAFNEEFTKITTATLAANGWVSPNAQDNATIETDADHGSYLKFAPGGANDRNVKGTFPADARLTEDYVLTFDTALTYGNNHGSDFTVYDSSASVGNNASVASNYILKLNNGGSNSTTWTVNGSEDTVSIPAGTWVNVYMVVHPSAGNADLVIKNGETELFNKKITINGTGVPGGINMLSGRYYGVMSIDNIKLYTADQIPE